MSMSTVSPWGGYPGNRSKLLATKASGLSMLRELLSWSGQVQLDADCVRQELLQRSLLTTSEEPSYARLAHQDTVKQTHTQPSVSHVPRGLPQTCLAAQNALLAQLRLINPILLRAPVFNAMLPVQRFCWVLPMWQTVFAEVERSSSSQLVWRALRKACIAQQVAHSKRFKQPPDLELQTQGVLSWRKASSAT